MNLIIGDCRIPYLLLKKTWKAVRFSIGLWSVLPVNYFSDGWHFYINCIKIEMDSKNLTSFMNDLNKTRTKVVRPSDLTSSRSRERLEHANIKGGGRPVQMENPFPAIFVIRIERKEEHFQNAVSLNWMRESILNNLSFCNDCTSYHYESPNMIILYFKAPLICFIKSITKHFIWHL